jgi:hypothetical protein
MKNIAQIFYRKNLKHFMAEWKTFCNLGVQTNKFYVIPYLRDLSRLFHSFIIQQNSAGAGNNIPTWFVCKLSNAPRHLLFSTLKSLQK